MGFTIVLEDERGERLEELGDPTNILHRLLPDPDDKTYQHLGMIDWYGDTVFNHLQAKRFLEEWRRLEPDASEPKERELLEAIEKMATTVANECHLYLKFYGD